MPAIVNLLITVLLWYLLGPVMALAWAVGYMLWRSIKEASDAD